MNKALREEKKQSRSILFPIRIDHAVMEDPRAWAEALLESRHIGNFENWADPAAYQRALDRLLRDLRAPAENSVAVSQDNSLG